MVNPRFLPLLFLFVGTLTGCLSMSKQEKTENVSPPISVQKSVDQSLASSFFVKGGWPKQQWWESFKQEELNRLIQEALAQNPSLKSVESRIQQAKAQATITKSKLFPILFFNADDNWRYLSKNSFTHLLNPSLSLNGYEVDLSLAFQFEFDFWGKNQNLFRSALGEIKAAEAELEQAKLILTTALAQSYFATALNISKKALYEKLCSVQDKKLKLQELLLKHALSSKLSPLWNEEKLNEAKQNLLMIEDEIQVENHLINILAGRSPDHEIAFDPIRQKDLSPFPVPRDLSINLLSRRPDLIAQIWRVESLSLQVSAAKADFFPNVNLSALVGLASISFQQLFKMGSKTAGIEPALSLPIFTAGSISANVKSKKSAFDAAVFDYNQLLLFAAQEVADLLSHVETAFSQRALQKGIVSAAKERYLLTKLQQDSALVTEFAALDYEEELLLQEIKDLSIQYSQYAFIIKLIKSLGGGFIQPSPILSGEDS